jgi:hypothetical protein
MGKEIIKPEPKKLILRDEEHEVLGMIDKLPDDIKRMLINSLIREKKGLTKAELSLLPLDIIQIVPAPAFNKLNCLELCGKVTTLTGIIGGITEFALCFPANADVIAINEVLTLIAPKGMNLTDSQKILKKLLFPQLRRYIYAEILSCAAIANGDTVLFGELGVPVKKVPVAFTRKCPAPQHAYADTKLGRGLLGTGCEVIDHATKGYCTAFGDPEVDPDLWLVKVGGRVDTLPPMVPGTPIGWQKAAMGRAGVGYFSETVVTYVPFN